MNKLFWGGLLALAILVPSSSWGAQVYGRYRVQPGDTLRSISERLLGDPDRWTEIYKLNIKTIGNDPNNLKHDSILLIPIPEEKLQGIIQRPLETPSPKPTETPTPPPSSTLPSYTVKPGEGLMGIARRELKNPTRWREIYQLNRSKIGGNPDRIQVGAQLNLPAAQASAPPAGPHEYEVQEGDTLYKIARKVYHDQRRWREIFDKNRALVGKNPNKLKPGIRLSLP